MFCLIENSLPFVKRFTKRQRLMLRLLLISVFIVMAGAYLKITNKPDAEWLLGLGLLFHFLSVIGLLSKWAKYRIISESKNPS